MSSTKSDASGNRKKSSSEGSDPFLLPRKILRHLKLNGADREGGNVSESAHYLWINIDSKCEEGCEHTGPSGHRLSVEEWLNVVDEAASLGVRCVMICVGDSLAVHPEVWEICRWAQETHGMNVGFHTVAESLGDTDLDQLAELDQQKTCLFVKRENLDRLKPVEERGIRLCHAEVQEKDHCPPCDEPKSMVFVGPDGVLYSCGMVLGNDRFRLGHVSEKPLDTVMTDEKLPRNVPAGTPHNHHGCDACPPLMFKRISQQG